MSFFGFGQSAEISIELDNEDTRKVAKMRGDDGNSNTYYLFYDGETVSGTVRIKLKKANQKLEHQGIRVEFIGQVEVYYDRGNQQDFISLTKDLARPGELIQNNTDYRFEFNNVEKPYESYIGTNVKLRYFLRVTIVRRLQDIVREMDLVVHALSTYPDNDSSIKMEVGIEDCLHIEFEYNKNRYHLRDVIVGKIYFLLVRIKIKYMEIAILKTEFVGSGPNTFKETETVAKFEIMDGAPVRGESIPIRLFLGGYDLTPTMRDVAKKFSVKYLLNLVLIDEEDRRYFKQQEVTFWRKADTPLVRKSLANASMTSSVVSNSAAAGGGGGDSEGDATSVNAVDEAADEVPPPEPVEDTRKQNGHAGARGEGQPVVHTGTSEAQPINVTSEMVD